MNRLTLSALVATLMMGSVSLAVAQSGSGGAGVGGSSGDNGRSGTQPDSSDSTQDRGTGVINPGGSQGTTQQGRLSQSDVQSMLQQRGYSQVGEIEMEDGMYETRAMRNGQSVNVLIDPSSGTITER